MKRDPVSNPQSQPQLNPSEPDLPATLAALTGVVARLGALLRTEGQRADLQLLQTIAARLHRSVAAPKASASATPGLLQFEPDRFHRLLELAGPKHSSELLARLGDDLSATRAKLSMAAQSQDWQSLHQASHVLVSLSGSVGALSLQHLSEKLNALANAKDSLGLADLMTTTLAELDALIAIVATTSARAGG